MCLLDAGCDSLLLGAPVREGGLPRLVISLPLVGQAGRSANQSLQGCRSNNHASESKYVLLNNQHGSVCCLAAI